VYLKPLPKSSFFSESVHHLNVVGSLTVIEGFEGHLFAKIVQMKLVTAKCCCYIIAMFAVTVLLHLH